MLPLVLALLVAPPLGAQQRVILFIGDGVGVSYWTAARFAADDLNVAQFKVMGLVDTRASNSHITDSAAGATAYATGIRTFNGAIGVGPDSAPVQTVLEVAKERGMATGLVATSSITHATPASFAAHVPSRASQFEIAAQMSALGVDVILGGGLQWFSAGSRPDHVDLMARLASAHRVTTTAAGLDSVMGTRPTGLIGLFADDQMAAAPQRTPTLPAMTRAAIDVLSRDPEGFFLMVEGSQPDWRGHANEPLEAVTAEMLDFDAAIGVALEYQRRQPDVLIVVVSDHETGGLAIETSLAATVVANTGFGATMRRLAQRFGFGKSSADSASAAAPSPPGAVTPMPEEDEERIVADYTTSGHTGQMIPLFASGPGAEQFGGMIDNYRVGELLLERVRKAPPPRRRP